jgi:hypothetical protein
MSGRSRRKKYVTKDTHISEFRNCMWSTILITFTHPEVHINKKLAGAKVCDKIEVATADDFEVSFTYIGLCIQHKMSYIRLYCRTCFGETCRLVQAYV